MTRSWAVQRRFAVLCVIAACLLPLPAVAEELLSVPWEIIADSITRYKAPDNIVAEGNVVLRQREPDIENPLEITADWVRYDVAHGVIKARGNLLIRSGEEQITAEEASLDLNRQAGTIKKTTLFYPGNNLYFQGDVVEKTGELTYRFKDGWVTTCPVESDKAPIWSIKSAETNITVEGYAVLKKASFRIKDVPVLYTPYLILPAKTKRETGFLFPEFSQSGRDGTGLITPFFINLSPSSDITLYPGYLGKRGGVAGVEFRYVAAENSRGTFVFTSLHDRTEDKAGDEYKTDGYLRLNSSRYWLRGKVDHDFGNDIEAKLDLDVVSDRDYLQEFRKGITGFDVTDREFAAQYNRGFQEETIPYRESTLQLTKRWAAMFAGAEMRAVTDVWDVASTSTHVQTLPRIVFNGRRAIEKLPLQLAWDSEYVNYWRDSGVGAHRLDVHPRLVAPVPFGRLIEGAVTGGLRQTFYQVEIYGDTGGQWPHDEGQSRTVWDIRAGLAMPVARDFSLRLGSIEELTHLFRPNVTYEFVPSVEQDDLPHFDAIDRIERKNRLTYGLDNYFKVRGKRAGGAASRRFFGYAKVSQTYDIREERRTLYGPTDKQRPFSDFLFEFEMFPIAPLKVRYETALSVYGKGVTHYDLLTRFANDRGDSLSMDYRYKRHPDVEEPYFYTDAVDDSLHTINFAMKKILSDRLSVRGDLSRSFASDNTVDASLHLIYQPGCWGVELLASRTPDDNRLALIFSLTGFGKVLDFGLSEF